MKLLTKIGALTPLALGLMLGIVLLIQACNKSENPTEEPLPQQPMSRNAEGETIMRHPQTDQTVNPEETANPKEMVMGSKIFQDYTWQIIPNQSLQPGKPVTLTFDITEKKTGIPIQNLQVAHEKLAHLVIVSQDLKAFQHLHPAIGDPGHMIVENTFPKAGQYLLFLQFQTAKAGEQTLRQTLQIGQAKSSSARLVPDADQAKTVDGYIFKLSNYPTKANVASMPTVSIERDGRPVEQIQSFLGAGGHAVIISQDTQSFLHVHPMTKPVGDNLYRSPIAFHTLIPEPGLYKLWTQFQINGKVQTADFTFQVW
ncbi:MAG: hypothetical protein K2X01_11535 [Cyanobacteria bacterium]|nr:hypothetical protein [Cyanobacteriota bacterium]